MRERRTARRCGRAKIKVTTSPQGLWETNGMAGGTRELAATGGEDNEFTVFNGEVLFVDANSTTLSHSLWVTDGTTAGTTSSAA